MQLPLKDDTFAEKVHPFFKNFGNLRTVTTSTSNLATGCAAAAVQGQHHKPLSDK